MTYLQHPQQVVEVKDVCVEVGVEGQFSVFLYQVHFGQDIDVRQTQLKQGTISEVLIVCRDNSLFC